MRNSEASFALADTIFKSLKDPTSELNYLETD